MHLTTRRAWLAGTGLALVMGAPVAQAADAAPLVAVAVTTQPSSASMTSFEAVVEAVRQTTLSTQVPGAIVALHVKAGDRVRAGQELLRVDARAAQQNVAASASQVEAAQAALNVANKEYERQKQLLQKQYISQAALDRIQAEREAAQAQVQALQAQNRAAQTQSGFFVLNAPYAGVISDLAVTLGDMAMPGRPLMTLHDPSALRVTAALPETLLPSLGGQIRGARYDIAGQGGPRPAAQVQLLPTVDAATHTIPLRLTLPPGLPGVAPGMFARVWLPLPETSAAGGAAAARDGASRLYVPASSVLRRAELTAVYVIDAQGKPLLRQIRLGRPAGDQVEVLSGLRPGEQIAADPQAAAARR
ncbi:MAG: efflux RND transporter periplasmic adaptor subunit [Rhodoferax sp.]|nr:efflux RND transporter periplasmic adaptor subunit [Rhodoferax sp.]